MLSADNQRLIELKFICDLNTENPVCVLNTNKQVIANNNRFSNTYLNKDDIIWETVNNSWGQQQLLKNKEYMIIKWKLNRPELIKLLDNIPIYIWVMDKDGKCIYYSGKTCSVPLIDTNMIDLLEKRGDFRIVQDIKKALSGTATSNLYDVVIENKKRKIESHFSPIFEQIDDKRVLVSVSGVSIDITEHLENTLNDTILDSIKIKSDFIGITSHELRSPLVGLMGFLEVLESTVLSIEQIEYVKIIRESSNSLLNTINSILDYSKIKSGIVNIESEEINIIEIIDSIIKTKEYEIKTNYEPEVFPKLLGDSIKLKKVIQVLVDNAVKFNKNEPILVKTRINELNADDCTFVISVKDSGIGIPIEIQDKIFQPFVQVDSSVERKYDGAGLGLAIIKGLLDLMKGKITFKSEINNGSEFCVELKLKLI